MTFRVTFVFIMIHNEIECSGRGSQGYCRDEEWTPKGMLSFAVGKAEQKKNICKKLKTTAATDLIYPSLRGSSNKKIQLLILDLIHHIPRQQ